MINADRLRAERRRREGFRSHAPERVFVSLDGNKPENALFVSEPDGSTVLRLWRGREVIDLRTDEDGARVSVSRGRKAFREAPGKMPDAQLLGYCTDGMTEEACRACLGLS